VIVKSPNANSRFMIILTHDTSRRCASISKRFPSPPSPPSYLAPQNKKALRSLEADENAVVGKAPQVLLQPPDTLQAINAFLITEVRRCSGAMFAFSC